LVTVEQAESKFKYSVNKIIRLYINLLYYNRGVNITEKRKNNVVLHQAYKFCSNAQREEA